MKKIEVLFENKEILIINKPFGLAVQGGKRIANPLDKILPEQLGFPIYLVHRLDRETSGLMIVAKSPMYAAQWTKLIGGKLVQKEYTAICIGKPTKKSGTMTDSIIQHGTEKNAITRYRLIDEKEIELDMDKDRTNDTAETEPILQTEKITLSKLNLHLETGRMHQIRIHLAKLALPIAGDDKHGNFKLNKLLRKKCGIKQLLLCATSLSFPENGRQKTIKITPPEYFPF